MELPTVRAPRRGGDLALDFLNTVSLRLAADRRGEKLPTHAHLLAWSRDCELLTEAETVAVAALAAAHPRRAAEEHRLTLDLRDDTYAALTDGRAPTALPRDLAMAQAASTLTRAADGTWAWTQSRPDETTPRARLAFAILRLLTSPEIARFHRCEDRDCGWVFLDTSRQRNRRWCSSADCGNRNRARRHYERGRS